MKRLSKEESRKRWSEIRRLWNEWDPIGVISDDLRDEYDNYIGPGLRLLERKASEEEITAYLNQIVGEYMGLGDQGLINSNPQQFAQKLVSWYATYWPNTKV